MASSPPPAAPAAPAPAPSTYKMDESPPTTAELEAFQTQATLSLSILFNQMAKFVPDYKPKTVEELARESNSLVQAKPTAQQALVRKLTARKKEASLAASAKAGPSSLKRPANGKMAAEEDDEDEDEGESRFSLGGAKKARVAGSGTGEFEGKKAEKKKRKALAMAETAAAAAQQGKGKAKEGTAGATPTALPTPPVSATPSLDAMSTASVQDDAPLAPSSALAPSAPNPPNPFSLPFSLDPPARSSAELPAPSEPLIIETNFLLRPRNTKPKAPASAATAAAPLLNLVPLAATPNPSEDASGKKKKKNRKARKWKGSAPEDRPAA